MAQIDYIHISLRAEVDSATRTVFSYPPSAEPQAWEKRLVTPAVAIKRFLNAAECYVLQQWDDGHCFSYITSSNQRPESGYCMISVFVNAGCALKGRQLIDIFSGLKKVLVEDEERSTEAVEKVLDQAGVPAEPLHLRSWDFRAEPPATLVAEAAYRTFMTMGELVEIFGYPSQPEYADYRCVIVVPASASLRPGTKMTRITAPVRKLYTITAPAGVEVSATSAFDGDRLTVTYNRDGFDPVKETVTVGTPSAYTRIEGTTIRFREPRECGVRFVRRVPLVVRSSKGGDITGYTIAINGRSVNTMEPFVEFTEKDLKSASTVEIKAASNNFAPLKIVKTTAEIMATDNLEIELTPIEQGVVLRLDFGDDRVIEYFLSIERNTPEYNRLHAGSFHGFRAHRAVNQDPDDPRVIYNVDLRADAPKVEKQAATPRNKVPVFENVSDGADEQPDTDQEIDTSVPTVDTTTPADELALAEEDVKKPSRLRLYLLAAAAAIVILVVVLVFVIPSGKTIGSELDDSPAQVASADSVTAVAPESTSPAPAPAISLGADAAYLDNNSVWDMSQLTSAAGVALMQAFKDGDVDAIANNEYFAGGVCTNSRARKALELMWRGKTGPTRASIARAVRKAAESGKIDLGNLVDRLARVQPHAEDANTLPLPTR